MLGVVTELEARIVEEVRVVSYHDSRQRRLYDEAFFERYIIPVGFDTALNKVEKILIDLSVCLFPVHWLKLVTYLSCFSIHSVFPTD